MISSDHLAPGTLGRIRASMDTTGRRGPLMKHITIHSNDRTNPTLSFRLIMDVVPK